ncbi:MAG: C-GCAxxG-C-C family protein [Pelotomaculum sp.]|jgi:C_GCAxxG_C_C family probable redox protein
MLKKRLSKTEVLKYFSEGLSCSQVVLMQWADELGYEKQEALKMAAAFGGGMFRGDTCGAVAGAHIAIGLKYGGANTPAGQEQLLAKVAEFQEQFIEKRNTTICRELIGYDFSVEGELEKAREDGKLMQVCPEFVIEALEVLDEIMQEPAVE